MCRVERLPVTCPALFWAIQQGLQGQGVRLARPIEYPSRGPGLFAVVRRAYAPAHDTCSSVSRMPSRAGPRLGLRPRTLNPKGPHRSRSVRACGCATTSWSPPRPVRSAGGAVGMLSSNHMRRRPPRGLRLPVGASATPGETGGVVAAREGGAVTVQGGHVVNGQRGYLVSRYGRWASRSPGDSIVVGRGGFGTVRASGAAGGGGGQYGREPCRGLLGPAHHRRRSPRHTGPPRADRAPGPGRAATCPAR